MTVYQVVFGREAGPLGVGDGNESRISSFTLSRKLALAP